VESARFPVFFNIFSLRACYRNRFLSIREITFYIPHRRIHDERFPLRAGMDTCAVLLLLIKTTHNGLLLSWVGLIGYAA
jgi:hypothetical protein